MGARGLLCICTLARKNLLKITFWQLNLAKGDTADESRVRGPRFVFVMQPYKPFPVYIVAHSSRIIRHPEDH